MNIYDELSRLDRERNPGKRARQFEVFLVHLLEKESFKVIHNPKTVSLMFKVLDSITHSNEVIYPSQHILQSHGEVFAGKLRTIVEAHDRQSAQPQ
jgi:hypothetical protein